MNGHDGTNTKKIYDTKLSPRANIYTHIYSNTTEVKDGENYKCFQIVLKERANIDPICKTDFFCILSKYWHNVI